MTKTHGGYRPGSGRKPIADRTEAKSVKLTPDQWEKARQIGSGNMAEGIRKALDAFRA